MARQTPTIPVATTATVGVFRPDIQGLRAVAVLAVVADHLLGWPTGGFVGVDVFFVISGFLITDLLLREHLRSGRISLTAFYRRRARRILPAALVCLALVVATAWVVHRVARAEAITVDALFSAVFAANWHFAAVGTDYLGAATPTSPLQHFWSLAVEEQFYLLWPVVLGILLGVVAARFCGRDRVLIAALAVIVLGSFGWSVIQTATAPTWGYFSTLTRGWEIAAGALLAVVAGRLTRLPAALRSAMSLGGLGLIAAGLLLLSPRLAVPGPWSAVPVAGALLVLAAGLGDHPPRSRLLTNPGAQYVGRISYSVYLWHFPVIVLLAALLPQGPVSVAATAAVIAAIAITSYHLIEEPLRHRPASGSRFIGARRIHAGRARTGPLRAGAVAAATAVGVVFVVLLAHGASGSAVESGSTVATGEYDPAGRLAADLDAALQADSWPVLIPDIDGLSQAGRPPRDDECATGLVDPQADRTEKTAGSPDPVVAPAGDLTGDAAKCAFGDPSAPRLAVVAGDSIAITWMPLVQELLGAQGYRIQGLTMSGCPFVATETRNPAADITAYCPLHKAAAVAAIRRLKPDIVVVSNTFRPWLRGSDDDPGERRYAEGQRAIIEQFATSTTAVYVLAPPPPGNPLEDCATVVSTPADCVSTIPDDWRAVNAAMAERLSGTPGTTYVDTSGWFCAGGRCPSFVDSTPVQRDGTGHLIPAYAQRLAPVFAQLLDRQGP